MKHNLSISRIDVPIPNGTIKISPSSLTLIRSNPSEWLRKLENTSTFKGTYNTVQGTCIHFIFECIIKHDMPFFEIKPYLEEYTTSEIARYVTYQDDNGMDYQVEEGCITEFEATSLLQVLEHTYYQPIEFFVKTKLQHNDNVKKVHSEVSGVYLFKGLFAIAGTMDIVVEYDDGTLGVYDIKSTSRKISSLAPYTPQLLCYALIAKKELNLPIKSIGVLNVRLLKTKGVVFDEINSNMSDIEKERKMFTSILRQVESMYNAYTEYPDLKDVIFSKGVDRFGNL